MILDRAEIRRDATRAELDLARGVDRQLFSRGRFLHPARLARCARREKREEGHGGLLI